MNTIEGWLARGYGLGGDSRLVRRHLLDEGRFRECVSLPITGLLGKTFSIYSLLEHSVTAKAILSGTEKTGTSVVKGQS